MNSSPSHSTKEDILRYLLKEGQGSAIAMAEELGISPQAMRKHLKDLENEGLIEHRQEKQGTVDPSLFISSVSREGKSFPKDMENLLYPSLIPWWKRWVKNNWGKYLKSNGNGRRRNIANRLAGFFGKAGR